MSHGTVHVTMTAMYKHVIAAVVVASLLAAAGAGAATPPAHWCRQGDPPVYASAATTCELAGTVVTDYVDVCHQSSSCRIRVDSPASSDRYTITCNRHGARYSGTVFCEGTPAAGIWVRFRDLV